MNITILPQVDYEEDEFHPVFKSVTNSEKQLVIRAFNQTEAMRRIQLTCPCSLKSQPQILISDKPNVVKVRFGWFCQKCLNLLENELNIPGLLEVKVGRIDESKSISERRILKQGLIAELEDGTIQLLDDFSISMSSVTVGQFNRFVRETGYTTSAENASDYCNYRSNAIVSAVSRIGREHMPAYCVSYLDALAYCEWDGTRLPSEGELLAASLVDTRLMTSADKEKYLFSSGKFRHDRFPNALSDLGPQWVTGDAPPGKAVIRTGPFLVRVINWREL